LDGAHRVLRSDTRNRGAVFGPLHVVPRLQEFFTRHPDIADELLMSERLVNLIEDGVDVAIHNAADDRSP
jgi:DNA-binding transcriptional LysR family regulator